MRVNFYIPRKKVLCIKVVVQKPLKQKLNEYSELVSSIKIAHDLNHGDRMRYQVRNLVDEDETLTAQLWASSL